MFAIVFCWKQDVHTNTQDAHKHTHTQTERKWTGVWKWFRGIKDLTLCKNKSSCIHINEISQKNLIFSQKKILYLTLRRIRTYIYLSVTLPFSNPSYFYHPLHLNQSALKYTVFSLALSFLKLQSFLTALTPFLHTTSTNYLFYSYF